ncbi:hypothetical protein Droror1_Dr00002184 [Drosera rotundifolia]
MTASSSPGDVLLSRTITAYFAGSTVKQKPKFTTTSIPANQTILQIRFRVLEGQRRKQRGRESCPPREAAAAAMVWLAAERKREEGGGSTRRRRRGALLRGERKDEEQSALGGTCALI